MPDESAAGQVMAAMSVLSSSEEWANTALAQGEKMSRNVITSRFARLCVLFPVAPNSIRPVPRGSAEAARVGTERGSAPRPPPTPRDASARPRDAPATTPRRRNAIKPASGHPKLRPHALVAASLARGATRHYRGATTATQPPSGVSRAR